MKLFVTAVTSQKFHSRQLSEMLRLFGFPSRMWFSEPFSDLQITFIKHYWINHLCNSSQTDRTYPLDSFLFKRLHLGRIWETHEVKEKRIVDFGKFITMASTTAEWNVEVVWFQVMDGDLCPNSQNVLQRSGSLCSPIIKTSCSAFIPRNCLQAIFL
jgi:hypothetical protein